LGSLDLLELASRPIDTLSGGERQRVLVARALAQQSRILLLDEPTTALDIGHQQEVLELIDKLRYERGLAVVSTMHDLTIAAQYPDRLALLSAGRVVTVGTGDEVLTEDLLAAHYGATVRILRDDDGIVVIPTRTKRPPR
jgi:iron complex transport system ATP-binding protein